MNNKRAHFRLEYPPSERPRLYFEKHKLEVLDASEKGLKVALSKEFQPAPGSKIGGVVHFKAGPTCKVDGSVLRISEDRKFCVILLTAGIPLPRMMEEQRRIIQKYKS